jgi:hypothetical protein
LRLLLELGWVLPGVMRGAMLTGTAATLISTTAETRTSIEISIAANIKAETEGKAAGGSIILNTAKGFLTEIKERRKSSTEQAPTTLSSRVSSFVDEPNKEDNSSAREVPATAAQAKVWEVVVVAQARELGKELEQVGLVDERDNNPQASLAAVREAVAALFKALIVAEAAPEALATVGRLAGGVSPEVAEREAVVEEVPGVVVAVVVEEEEVAEAGGGDKQKTRDEWRVTSEGNFPRHSTLGTIDSF